MTKASIAASVLTGLAAAAMLVAVSEVRLAQQAPARAHFNADGTVQLPIDYRNWTHVGTRVKAAGINILDGWPTKGPELFNAYVEPGTIEAFEQTGSWPDGTQIVKEFSALRDGDGCDAKTTYCSGPLGVGIFETGYIGLGLMIKDSARFKDAPGNWGYFNFGHQPAPYKSNAAVSDASKCQACHVELASDTDYVITKAHLGLRR